MVQDDCCLRHSGLDPESLVLTFEILNQVQDDCCLRHSGLVPESLVLTIEILNQVQDDCTKSILKKNSEQAQYYL